MTNKQVNKRITKARSKVKKDSYKLKKAERYTPDKLTGLSQEIVNGRIDDNLTNDKPINRSKSYARIIIENVFNFCNTVSLILVVLLIAVGQPNQTVSSCIILFNMAIGMYQEIKAKWTVEKLSIVVDSTCEVLRDGIRNIISTKDLVLDDLFIMNAGLQVPVDGIIVDGFVELDESILTGESAVVKKTENNPVLAGSYVMAGEALVRADKVGKDCYIENVARIARRVSKPHSNIFNVLDRLIKGITIALTPLALLLFISTRLVAGASITATVMQVAGSIFGMLPIGMFLLTSTALASSVLKLSKKNTLAQDLYSIEMLAMVDTLLLDKTGTITDGKLEVTEEITFEESVISVNDIIATLLNATHDKNPTAMALKAKYGGGEKLVITEAVPFSSVRKFSAVEMENNTTYCLGAPEYVIENSAKLNDFVDINTRCCKRVLVLARFDGKLCEMKKDKMVPLYAFSLQDKLRDDVQDTLKWFYDNDVDIKIVSGDNPVTVSEIAEKTGVHGAENYINCNGVSDEELESLVLSTTVFGRVAPDQKSKIVHMLQNKGRVVGMIGDGVNDVQALKEADCSISFASANEVARNISRIVMMDSNFKTLPNAVGEGRRVISNVEKVSSLYVMKNLFVMFMTLMFAVFTFIIKKDIYPFVPTRMLLIEFFVIGVPTFCFALQSNNTRVKGNFLRNIMKSCIPAGISLIIGVGLILILLATGVIDVSSMGNAEQISGYESSIAVITLTMAGFSALFIIALPLNKFRLVVISMMFFISILAIYLDQLLLDGWFLTIDFITDPVHIMWIAVGTAVATICHIGLQAGVKLIDKKLGRKAVFKTVKQGKII